MQGSRWVALAVALVVTPALAGCTDEAPGAAEEPIRKGSTTSPTGGTGTTGSSPTTPSPTPVPRPSNSRWHFHDYWEGQPTIVLLDTIVNLSPSQGPDGLPVLSAVVTLPAGTIVPPETGHLNVSVTWEREGGLVNLTIRPADTNDFVPVADLAKGAAATIPTTESMTDVPHRQASLWAFNLTAKPGGDPPGVPDQVLRFNLTATIGRPLFIDPPHVNWWRDGEVIPLVLGASGPLSTARTPAGAFTLPGEPERDANPGAMQGEARVGVDEGRIVPEGSKSIVVLLNWTSDVPGGKLAVHYREGNLGSTGALEVARDGDTNRVFVLAVDNDQTDTTYSNRTTWEFRIVPEGADTAAFSGSFVFYAWATRLEPAEAVVETVGE